MSYQVLARKWRPKVFAELAGQEHVLRALVNALDNDRLHHAYLFTGTRGVGKTTIARILAKSLNCETGVSSTPCGVCPTCTEIAEGRFVDLIEVDAASRTKVEDTRELLDNVQYAPTRGRYKVYLIDEVHMLSSHSFNALLKTLEEPPPHVKFLLATTDPQRLPVTILSRCLQFNLKRLTIELIRDHLQYILKEEKLDYEAPSLMLLARAADGSMRDALSLLDQAIAYGGGTLNETDVRTMLGTVEQRYVLELLQALANGDGDALLEVVHRLAEQAPDFSGVLADMIALLYRLALARTVPGAVDESLADHDEVAALAETISAEDVQLYYQIALIGRRDLPLAPDPRSGFEMILLRMLAFRPGDGSVPGPRVDTAVPSVAPSAAGSAKVTVSDRSASSSAAPPLGSSAADVSRQSTAVADCPAAAENSATVVELLDSSEWPQVVEKLRISGMVKELAANCAMVRRNGDTLYLQLSEPHKHLLGEQREKRLEQALQHYCGGAPLKVRFAVEGAITAETPARRNHRLAEERQREAERSIESSAQVQALQEAFDARIVPNSIRPAS
ncbi:MAG: DNA polymerase III subunit gamma/tau [Gammaproteobacteria bacterium]|nr:DNA polymerase III subunit gamma/tau [Gammaproteobacteria bacterium]